VPVRHEPVRHEEVLEGASEVLLLVALGCEAEVEVRLVGEVVGVDDEGLEGEGREDEGEGGTTKQGSLHEWLLGASEAPMLDGDLTQAEVSRFGPVASTPTARASRGHFSWERVMRVQRCIRISRSDGSLGAFPWVDFGAAAGARRFVASAGAAALAGAVA